MFVLDINKVKAGDIFLTRKNDRESRIIRERSGSDYGHALLYVGVSSCIESEGDGVQSENLQRLLFENPDDVVVLRLSDKNLNDLIPGAIVFARQKVGMEYSTDEAKLARTTDNKKAREENRQFCTRFVAQAYRDSGVKLVENPDYCTPQEILESEHLIKVENVVRAATDKEIHFILNSFNPVKKQREITNDILDKVRALTSNDVQTFEQITSYVVNHSEVEQEITQIFKDSDYFKIWEWEMEENPWHYDYEKLVDYYKDTESRNYVGYFFATTENETRKRYNETLITLFFGYSINQQEYFKIHIDLYLKLIELSHTRENIGLRILNQ